ncbi:SpoIIE family protein phosphatase [Streptomyces phyllanthi]|uniref:SpoIIE family protein phosphatase n=1 Tax=Streptomyces phyllanthi TaxID=1803180 RepID=UPI002AD276B1|nr:SpoIIE family protein phosphatase [Streptomyces phyllanthi]
MGAIPTQRESTTRAPGTPAHNGVDPRAVTHASLPGGPLAPGAARRFTRVSLAEWTRLALPGAEHLTETFADDVLVVVSELVTNAVVHAGTDVELLCRLEAPEYPGDEPVRVVVEISDHHPARVVRDDGAERPYSTERPHDTEPSFGTPEYGRGLRLVSALSDAWGITYRTGVKTVWARLPVDGGAGVEENIEAYAGDAALEHGLSVADILAPVPRRSAERDQDWLNRGALSFLAEASDLLAGQLDEDLVAALAGQLLVPRLADWCAVWLEDEGMGWRGAEGGTFGSGPRLARVWHVSENRIEDLRCALLKDPPRLPESVRSRAVPVAWPDEALGGRGETGTALAYRLIAGGRPLGALVIGRAGVLRFADEVTGLVEDLSRRVALAIGAARQYARQATISRVLQRGLLPGAVAEIPGMHSALVYEPCDKGGPSGDFYDLFPAGDGRWCFALGDVQGKGPEAAVVIGLARPWLRLLAREGYQVAEVLDRLNQLLLDDATEAADAAARALVTAGGPGLGADEGPQTRFLSLLFGELVPFDGGVRCTLASAGHPLPLVLSPDGCVRAVAEPQTLLGVIEDTDYTCETFELYSGDTLLCVTDGVTERRCGPRMFDDGDGLAAALTGCAGLNAELVAERIRRLVHQFGGKPPEDDLALLVLQAE